MTKTQIGSHPSDTTRLRVRGKDTLSEVVGELSFTEGFYMVVTGRVPTATQRKVLDAALLVLMDHGLTPSALVARIVADSNPDDIQIPLAAGALMVGNRFAGTMVGAGRVLNEGMSFAGDRREWAKGLVAKFRESKRRIPGFGHPNYKGVDPRAARLFEVAMTAGVKGEHIALLKTLSEEIDADAGKQIVLNATGALGAILHEIDFPVEAMRAVAVVGRCAGLVGHVLEERSSPISPDIYAFSETIVYEDGLD
ncbi:citryl-CoA lyase [Variovorax sp. J31P207]|uniref:citryl-CoA lyase n=1 Tax=Variovorax sp. J31P207 TaxID=3053510 RepID=UPI0025761787|nr:citryl-CoA lyase [Variovorax sp. J31P207]MDM0065240.1 citryl-CoA lyase [Variovorax sp. J31P207]